MNDKTNSNKVVLVRKSPYEEKKYIDIDKLIEKLKNEKIITDEEIVQLNNYYKKTITSGLRYNKSVRLVNGVPIAIAISGIIVWPFTFVLAFMAFEMFGVKAYNASKKVNVYEQLEKLFTDSKDLKLHQDLVLLHQIINDIKENDKNSNKPQENETYINKLKTIPKEVLEGINEYKDKNFKAFIRNFNNLSEKQKQKLIKNMTDKLSELEKSAKSDNLAYSLFAYIPKQLTEAKKYARQITDYEISVIQKVKIYLKENPETIDFKKVLSLYIVTRRLEIMQSERRQYVETCATCLKNSIAFYSNSKDKINHQKMKIEGKRLQFVNFDKLK